ncbi:efflux RND transporter periplasmic adaptor subunit [Desulfovibrio ferrophilus]|uniref:Secretion protein HlyD family protein n=1 Tax=Desulfovibrio ferrophilus TaxID=241368 RepID=A0A2Z6B0B1_9BACT|nr:efflux RND transporter periplasmic adaptor subunit [Desulfovibrio ferrophilus]BBD08888.1 secretion protein HlyD family protein [Desulfovibrio ferrophilus]
MRKKIIIAILVFAIAALGLFWTTRSGDGKIEVLNTARVARGEVRNQLEATGIVKAQVGAIVKIGAQATGRITTMNVRVGDPVTQGDLIAVIDDRELKASEAEALARREHARAEFSRVKTTSPLRVNEAEAELNAAAAELDYAILSFERQRQLAEADLVAQDALDDARQNAAVKKSALRVKVSALERIRFETVEDQRKAQKTLAQEQAALDSIRTRLSYTRIISPLTGVVSQVAAQEGETVVTGLEVANLITVLDPTRLEMWIYVDETDIGRVRPGLPVEFQVDAYPGDIFNGTIDQIYPEPEIRDNIVYYQALVRLDKDQALRLRPEMTTQSQIIVEIKKDVLALPNAALKWVGGEQVVFVSEGKDVRKAYPELGLAGVTHSEVLSGLSEGDTVATQLVLPGQKKKKD